MFIERFINSWEGKEQFLKYSKAFVAIKADRIVGVIFGSVRYENIITIDIEVEKENRTQGGEINVIFTLLFSPKKFCFI